MALAAKISFIIPSGKLDDFKRDAILRDSELMKYLRLSLIIIGFSLLLSGFSLAVVNLIQKAKAQEERSSVILAAQSTHSQVNHPTETFFADNQTRTIPEAFEKANKEFYQEDKVTVFPDLSLGLGAMVKVERALPVELIDGKKRYTFRTWQETVGGLLKERNITLGEDDRISQSLGNALELNQTIQITRVARTQVSEFEIIPFEAIERNDPNTYRGEKKTVQQGHPGKREKKFLLIREDGELVSKTLISNTVVEKAQNTIIVIGTKLKIDSSKTRIGTASYYFGPTKIASNYLPKGTKVLITNIKNGRSFEGVIDDYMAHPTRVVDLHVELWKKIAGDRDSGLIVDSVKVEVVLN